MDPPSLQPQGAQEEQVVEYQDPLAIALDHIMSTMDSRSGSLPASPSRPEGRPEEDLQRDLDPAGPLGPRVRHAAGDPREAPATENWSSWQRSAAAQAAAAGGGIGPALAKAGAQASSYQPYSTWGTPFAGVPPSAGAVPSVRASQAPIPATAAGEILELRSEMARMQEQLSKQHQDQLSALQERYQHDYQQLVRATRDEGDQQA